MSITPYKPLTDRRAPGLAEGKTYIVFDCETSLIRSGLITPRLVCTSVLSNHRPHLPQHKYGVISVEGDGMYAALADAEQSLEWWARTIEEAHTLLTDTTGSAGDTCRAPTFIGQNVQFDVLVLTNACQEAGLGDGLMDKIFDLYEAGCFVDTAHRAKLIRLGLDGRLKGYGFSLAALVKNELDHDISASKKGPDVWRLRYNELVDVPLKDWPIEAVQYPFEDVYHTWDVYQSQCVYREGICDGEYVNDSTAQAMGHLGLALGSVWGFRVDRPRLHALDEELGARIAELEIALKEPVFVENGQAPCGLLRPTGSVNKKAVQAMVGASYDGNAPRTEPSKTYPEGQIKTSREVLEESGDPLLAKLAAREKLLKKKRDFVGMLLKGSEGDHPLCPRYDSIKETGRCSASKPNVQQIPRKGGERECFIPREGYLYVNADYDSLELRCWAYVCEVLLHHSHLADEYRKDPHYDPHLATAAEIMGQPVDLVRAAYAAGDANAKDHRSLAKIPNFGHIGGMGPNALPSYAKGVGVNLTVERAHELHRAWKAAMPDAEPYLEYIGDKVGYGDTSTMVQVGSKRMRAGCSYTQAANTMFQGLAGDGAKAALWLVTREMYGAPGKDAPPGDTTALVGSRMVAFIHDELLLETPKHLVNRAADRLVLLMKAGMGQCVKTVPIEVEASVSTRWSKQAKSTRDPATGVYTIWDGAA